MRASQLETAQVIIAQARPLADTTFWRGRLALWQGQLHFRLLRDLEAAGHFLFDAMDLARSARDPVTELLARTHHASVQLELGATQYALHEATQAWQDLGHEPAGELREVQVYIDLTLSHVYMVVKDYPSAIEHTERALAVAQQLQDVGLLGSSTATLAAVWGERAAVERDNGRTAAALQMDQRAADLLLEAVRLTRLSGHLEGQSISLTNLADALMHLGRAEEALAYLDEWDRQPVEVSAHCHAQMKGTRGQVLAQLGRHEEACPMFEQALELCGGEIMRREILKEYALVLAQCGRWQQAYERHVQYHAVHLKVGTEEAQRTARIAAVRMQTERARAEALSQRQRADDMHRLSTEDALTGLPNRRHIQVMLQDKVDAACIAMVDVDHFKEVNDVYSHAVGDSVLRELAAVLRRCCRSGDIAARLGGEEFVVMLNTPDYEAAIATVQRMRQQVQAYDWSVLTPGRVVTVSIGLAAGDEAPDGVAVLALADRRLYLAKHAGRNCVVAHG
jgi:diguanylate cyclase (GGDEF)-like protein